MPALVAGIHVLLSVSKGVDGRDKPGHDDAQLSFGFSNPSSAKRA